MRTLSHGSWAAVLVTASALWLGCEIYPPGSKTGEVASEASTLVGLACPVGGMLFGDSCVAGEVLAPPVCAGGLCPDLMTGFCVDCFIGCVIGSVCPVRPLSEGCPPGFAECSLNFCRDLLSDPSNCGACGLACRPGESCRSGTCLGPPFGCPPGFVECPPFGQCRNLRVDRINCGACGLACGLDQLCIEGACRPALAVSPVERGPLVCPVGLTPCGVECVDLDRSHENCGVCGVRCGFDEACLNGECVSGCPAGLTRCPSGCADLLVDEVNCGECGLTCAANAVCVSGTCL
ncbi:MAG TPA: hypothetical protein DFS52_22880 [Myxococcales bacterium]|nr:hypothetical protein [Myxococcales bacterium]